MARFLKNFPPGPLDYYRKRASFDWKQMKLFIDTEEITEYEHNVYRELEKYPEYNVNNLTPRSLDERRHLALKQALAYRTIELLSLQSLISDLKRPAASTRIMMQYFPDSTIKYSVTDRLFTSAIVNMGSDRHLHFVSDAEEGKATVVMPGGMRTTATYDVRNKHFILHSPDFEAAKCWTGGLGQCSTHAIVYAKLLLKGVDYGLHAFIVPVRDAKTLLPYPGLKIGDMGEKIGLNGLDNGFVQFNNYKLPRENLLNKFGDVTEDGEYVTPIKDPNKRHGAALGSLSGGRVNIACICEAMGTKAITIAVRYAAIRKQFGPDPHEEIPILEYQTHQYRLLPYLAAVYVLRIFNTFFNEAYFKFSLDNILGNNKDILPDLGVEIHAISSASKPLAGWIMKDAIQECREACGGHGYLKASNIGEIRNDHDANLTYEGENYVLIQQTSNWLLKLWILVLDKNKISTPLHSADFLTDAGHILRQKFAATTTNELCQLESIIPIYQWLVCHLLQMTHNKIESLISSGNSSFWAKNNSQVFYAKSLATVFIQHFFLKQMIEKISEADDLSVKNVLQKICLLYGLWSLDKHVGILYQGGYAHGPDASILIQESILKLCADLKDEAVSLVDAVAAPDFIVNSVLGASDGMVYKHLESAIYSSPYGLERPTWWRDVVNCNGDIKNKL
ncbi:hypothetical protein NQ315_003725 [Exocentrus adspersus]|uniref:Acyl-coenzyme A oxidase n=1 Tax=Exocentrus adspersus TaxID=1586481 RepID=A0AAV8VHM9_9CUCU|nr:hypothetical protein NQ315_003725 [Exocentrus adspersus]